MDLPSKELKVDRCGTMQVHKVAISGKLGEGKLWKYEKHPCYLRIYKGQLIIYELWSRWGTRWPRIENLNDHFQSPIMTEILM